MQCVGGRCQRDPNYCDDANACPAGRWCRNNQCSADCNDGDCQAGQYCDPTSRRCTAKPECGEFSDNPACPDGQECVGGTCQAKVNQCGGDPVLFDFDKSNIRRDQRGKLDAVAACMQDPNAAALLIEGHCDERGTEEYNLALGERRAEASKRYLEAKGVSAGRLNTRSMGESYPVDSGSNEKAWAKNRRTEFKSN
ncbi:MAG: OmpA family protein [Myxococcales bacterium]|nr:OmpA family protein [Myxococcales bacterium]